MILFDTTRKTSDYRAAMKIELNTENLYKEIVELVQEQLENAIENIKEDLVNPMGLHDGEMHLNKVDENLVISVFLRDDNTDVVAHCKFEIDDFLNETEDYYSYGEDGWGEEMIDDLEVLKNKIQDRIDKMKLTIANDA